MICDSSDDNLGIPHVPYLRLQRYLHCFVNTQYSEGQSLTLETSSNTFPDIVTPI